MKAFVLAVLSAAPAAGPAALQVWPSRAERLGDGRVEYTYDLGQARQGKVNSDVLATFPAEEVQRFLGALPPSVVVTMDTAPAAYGFGAHREADSAPVSATFAATPGPPKVLPSAELLLWKSLEGDQGLLAALFLAAEEGAGAGATSRQDLWLRVLKAAVARFGAAIQPTAKAGALLLSARLGAAVLESGGALPKEVAGVAEVTAAIDADLGEWRKQPPAELDPRPDVARNPRVARYLRGARFLSAPLPTNREGVAAAVTFLAILEQDPKLEAAYAKHVAFRDAVWGKPKKDTLELYRKALGAEGPLGALKDLGVYLGRLEKVGIRLEEPQHGATLFGWPETPVSAFYATFGEGERGRFAEELVLALQDGRVRLLQEASSPWDTWRRAAWVLLVQPEKLGFEARVVPEPSYRSRLTYAFLGLNQSLPEEEVDLRVRVEEPRSEPSREFQLRLELEVPPYFELEPLPELYGKVAQAYQRLVEVLSDYGKAGAVSALALSGTPRTATVLSLAKKLGRLYRGLELLSVRALDPAKYVWLETAADREALDAASQLLRSWQEDADLRAAVRGWGAPTAALATAHPEREVNVGRQVLEVTFAKSPRLEVSETPKLPPEQLSTALVGQEYTLPVLARGTPERRVYGVAVDGAP